MTQPHHTTSHGPARPRVSCNCITCGKSFTVNAFAFDRGAGKYCSRACKNYGRRQSYTCAHCGQVFHRPISQARTAQVFCSPTCVNQHHSRPLADRFWEKVNKDGPIPSHMPHLGQCWLWTANATPDGYGNIARGSSQQQNNQLLAHRVSWELHYGPIAGGLWVLHHCDNPPCVRPDHLFLGTNRDNLLDASSKGRTALGERNGRHVHPETCKLSVEQVLDIRQRIAQTNITYRALAREFGVHSSTISRIAAHKRWAYIE